MEEINETQTRYEEAKSQARHFSHKETNLINRLNTVKKEAREISEKLFSEAR